MGIVYHTNKKTGVTYAYENEAYWDTKKQQSRAKRKPIGKVDPTTKEIIPTREYKKKETVEEALSLNRSKDIMEKVMQDVKLFDQWTLQGLLDDLDTIELFEAPGHGRVLGEVTDKQEKI